MRAAARLSGVTLIALVIVVSLAALGGAQREAQGSAPEWSFNGTVIEACSCPMFCQCYFNTKPAGHGGHGEHAGHGGDHFCRFSEGWVVNKGTFGATKLDGVKFWLAGDLGGDFSMGKMDWAVLHFDPAVTKEQREGILVVLKHLLPVEWKSFTVGKDAAIEWKADKEKAVARADGGKVAEVVLKSAPGNDPKEQVVIKNLKYWGAPRNDGFILMPNEVEAYRVGPKAFEFKGTNGFVITVDINSDDVAGAAKGTAGK